MAEFKKNERNLSVKWRVVKDESSRHGDIQSQEKSAKIRPENRACHWHVPHHDVNERYKRWCLVILIFDVGSLHVILGQSRDTVWVAILGQLPG